MSDPGANPTESSGDVDKRLIDAARAQADGRGSGDDETKAAGDQTETISTNPLAIDNDLTLDARAVAGDAFPSIAGYLFQRKISGGGQGLVFEAIQESTKRRVAVKVIRGGAMSHPENRKRLQRGVRVLGQLHHPSIVGIVDSGIADGCLYYVMEYVAGVTLDDYVARMRSTSVGWNAEGSDGDSGSRSRRSRQEAKAERLTMHRLLTIFAKLCEALDVAHVRGVLHRDIKPANVLVDQRGEPHILDFDLAKILDGGFMPDEDFSAMTVSGEFLGSLRWASPEQVERKPSGIDLRTDVYSLGVVLYEMLTGQFPYPVVGTRREIEDNILHATPKKPHTIRKAVDDELETIVLKCLAKEPARRYRSAGDLAVDIRSYLNGDPISAKRDSGWYMLKKLAVRHKAATTVALSVVVILMSSLTYVYFAWRSAQDVIKERDKAVELASFHQTDAENMAFIALEARRETRFLWFLSEYRAGNMDRALQAASEFKVKGPRAEAITTGFLLGEIDVNTLEQVMPVDDALYKEFALAEWHSNEKQWKEAAELYNACRSLNGPEWLKREAASRRAELAGKTENAHPGDEQGA